MHDVILYAYSARDNAAKLRTTPTYVHIYHIAPEVCSYSILPALLHCRIAIPILYIILWYTLCVNVDMNNKYLSLQCSVALSSLPNLNSGQPFTE